MCAHRLNNPIARFLLEPLCRSRHFDKSTADHLKLTLEETLKAVAVSCLLPAHPTSCALQPTASPSFLHVHLHFVISHCRAKGRAGEGYSAVWDSEEEVQGGVGEDPSRQLLPKVRRGAASPACMETHSPLFLFLCLGVIGFGSRVQMPPCT